MERDGRSCTRRLAQPRRARAGRWACVAAVTLAAILVGATSRAGVPLSGEWLTVSPTAEVGPYAGVLFSIDLRTSSVRVISFPPDLQSPAAVSWGGRKLAYIGDVDRILVCDPLQSATEPPHEIDLGCFTHISDIRRDGSDGFYVLDERSDPLGEGGRGALYRFDPATETARLISGDFRFGAPAGMFIESDGKILIIDPQGKPQAGAERVPTIFRIDPADGNMVTLTTLPYAVAPRALVEMDGDTLLVADSEVEIPGYKTGAVWKLAPVTFAPIDTIVTSSFLQPTQVKLDRNGDLIVLDSRANPAGYSGGSGAIFKFDPHSGDLLDTYQSPLFQDLAGLEQLGGSELAESHFELQDSQAPLLPGDHLQLSATLINSGVEETRGLELRTQFSDLLFTADDVTASSGEVSFSVDDDMLYWHTTIAPGDSAHLEATVQVPWATEFGAWLRVPVWVESETATRQDALVQRVVQISAPGDVIYADAGQTDPAPRLFRFADSDEPVTIELDEPDSLGTPSDLVFAPDGTIYVLDGTWNNCRVLQVEPMHGTVTVLYRGEPLSRARGMCLGHDGALYIADPALSLPFTTGAVYRLDLQTGEMREFFSHPQVTDPVDICPDRLGHYLITDYTSTIGGDNSALVEVDGAGGIVNIYSSPYLRDPINATVVAPGMVFLCDIGFSDEQSAWMLTRIDRNGPIATFSAMAIASPLPFSRPFGIEALSPTEIIVCERDKNPLHSGCGSIIRGMQEMGIWNFEFTSYDASLIDPERVAVFCKPELYCANLLLDDTTGGQLVPGDTLVATATLNNRSPVAVRDGVAVVSTAYPLRVVSARADRGTTIIDYDGADVQWHGDVNFLDPLQVIVTYIVDPLAGHGDQAEIAVEFPGSDLDPVRAWRSVQAPLRGGDCLVLDSQGDPFYAGHHGAIYLANLEEDALTPLISHQSLVSPVDFIPETSERTLILDRDADPWMQGRRPGALFSLDVQTGLLRLLSASQAFVEPSRMRRHPNGLLLILDPMAQPSPTGGVGAIFSTPFGGGVVDTLSCDRAFRSLRDMAIDAQGRIWVTDASANPLNLPTSDTGAIFAVDVATGALTDTIAGVDFISPAAIECLPDGTMIFSDLGWTGPYGTLGIRRVNPATGIISNVINSSYLSTPTRFGLSPENEVMVIDSTGWYPDTEGSGMIFGLQLVPPSLSVALAGPGNSRLEGMAWVPRPRLVVTRMGTPADTAGCYVAPGGTLECELVLANQSSSDEPAAQLDLEFGPTMLLDPLSVSADAGTVSVAGNELFWTGVLAAGDSVSLRYQASAHCAPGLPSWAEQCAHTSGLLATPLDHCLTHYISTAIGPGELLIADSWANPRNFENTSGAVFRLEGEIREASPIFADSVLVSPTAVGIIPGSQTDLLILDADATIGGHIGQGGLFRASTRTGEIHLVFSDPTFMQPSALTVLDSTTCFVLDELADPLDYYDASEVGPGAIYKIDLRHETGEVFFSDTVMARPCDLDVDRTTGELYVVDRRAASSGQYSGAVFKIEGDGQNCTVLHAGAPFMSPRTMMRTEDGTIFIADPYPMGGMLFSMDPQGNVEPYIVCHDLVTPTDIVMGPRHRPLVIDAQANPMGYDGSMGTVLRFFPDGQVMHCSIYRTGPPLLRPRGAAIHFEGATPVELVSMELAEIDYGVELRWRSPGELAGADYYVYRRSTSGEELDYACLNRESPVTGTGDLSYVDPLADTGESYEYLLVAYARDGQRFEFGPYWIHVQGGGQGFALERIAPNPLVIGSTENVTVRYRIPDPGGDIRLGLFDLNGRLLRDLVRGECKPGIHSVIWDGRDENGRRITSGVYFLRLQAGHREMSRRLLMVR